jgi:hypothetical protein
MAPLGPTSVGSRRCAWYPDFDTHRCNTELDLGRDAVELWQRLVLLPGLGLMLRADAKKATRSAAQGICDEHMTLPALVGVSSPRARRVDV